MMWIEEKDLLFVFIFYVHIYIYISYILYMSYLIYLFIYILQKNFSGYFTNL